MRVGPVRGPGRGATGDGRGPVRTWVRGGALTAGAPPPKGRTTGGQDPLVCKHVGRVEGQTTEGRGSTRVSTCRGHFSLSTGRTTRATSECRTGWRSSRAGYRSCRCPTSALRGSRTPHEVPVRGADTRYKSRAYPGPQTFVPVPQTPTARGRIENESTLALPPSEGR